MIIIDIKLIEKEPHSIVSHRYKFKTYYPKKIYSKHFNIHFAMIRANYSENISN